jgi:serine/threonine protein kinase
MIDKTVNGYKLGQLLGSGGMADVYFSENKLGKKAAIKVLKTEWCAIKEIKDRFEQEARIMVGLIHINIRQALDIGVIEGRPAIIMEYLEGNTLKDLIYEGKLDKANIKSYFQQCLNALKVTSAKGIVHRDLKPSNIFITLDDSVKIMDFGIAKISESVFNTGTHQLLGTLLYMSPEQIQSPKNITIKSDIYSLAVTFYHALTDKVPYGIRNDSDFEIQRKIVFEDIDLSLLLPEWRDILKPMLMKNVESRVSIFDIEIGIVNETQYSKKSFHFQEIITAEPKAYQKKNLKKRMYVISSIFLLMVVIGGLFYLKSNYYKDLFVFESGGFYGYKDSKGNITIPAKYTEASQFEFGKAIVSVNDSIYTINTSGNVLDLIKPNWIFKGDSLLYHSFITLRKDQNTSFDQFKNEFRKSKSIREEVWSNYSKGGLLGSYMQFLEAIGFSIDFCQAIGQEQFIAYLYNLSQKIISANEYLIFKINILKSEKFRKEFHQKYRDIIKIDKVEDFDYCFDLSSIQNKEYIGLAEKIIDYDNIVHQTDRFTLNIGTQMNGFHYTNSGELKYEDKSISWDYSVPLETLEGSSIEVFLSPSKKYVGIIPLYDDINKHIIISLKELKVINSYKSAANYFYWSKSDDFVVLSFGHDLHGLTKIYLNTLKELTIQLLPSDSTMWTPGEKIYNISKEELIFSVIEECCYDCGYSCLKKDNILSGNILKINLQNMLITKY